jgi:hypothetical protein
LGQAINPKLITGVGADDGQLVFLGQIGGGTRMVNVRVGDPNLFERHTQLSTGIFQQGQITPGVDDGPLHRVITPDDGAILLERCNGNGFVLEHPEMVAGNLRELSG